MRPSNSARLTRTTTRQSRMADLVYVLLGRGPRRRLLVDDEDLIDEGLHGVPARTGRARKPPRPNIALTVDQELRVPRGRADRARAEAPREQAIGGGDVGGAIGDDREEHR